MAGDLAEIISISCLCTLLVSMTVTIAKNPKIKQMQKWLKYYILFATMTNIMALYETKRNNQSCKYGYYCYYGYRSSNSHSESKPDPTNHNGSKYWDWKIRGQYLSNSSYAMYSFLQSPFEKMLNSSFDETEDMESEECDVSDFEFYNNSQSPSIEYEHQNEDVQHKTTMKHSETEPTNIYSMHNLQNYNHFEPANHIHTKTQNLTIQNIKL